MTCTGSAARFLPSPPVEGLEHKDQRLHAAQGADWRDKLAEIGRDLPADEPAGDDENGRDSNAAADR